MKNFINYSIATTLASVGIEIILVLLIKNLVLAAICAALVVVIHTATLILYGYYEIMAEFGPKKERLVVEI